MQTREKQNTLQEKLQTAMEYAKNICIIGTNNKIEDIERTAGWSCNPIFRYRAPGYYIKQTGKESRDKLSQEHTEFNPETKKFVIPVKEWYYHADKKSDIIRVNPKTRENPLQDPFFKLQPEHFLLLSRALLAIELRWGPCNMRSCLISKYLWENSSGINRIEGIKMRTFDHWLVVVNRSKDSLLHDSDTWGDAWILDAWFKNGIICSANQFKNTLKAIKEYAKQNEKALAEINIQLPKCAEDGPDIDKSDWEIIPSTHRYPSYSVTKTIEDYYVASSAYPKGFFGDYAKNKHSHMEKFKSCLSKIQNLHTHGEEESERLERDGDAKKFGIV